MRWEGHVARMGDRRVTYMVVVWKLDGKRLLRRPRRRCEIIFKKTFKKWNGDFYGCENWLHAFREEPRLRVFENRGLREIFGPKRDEVTGDWRKVHNEALNDFYSLLNIVRGIKSRRMRWAGHVARMGKGGVDTGFRWGNLKERDHLGDPGVDERIILR